jgi:hypothetical protein
MGSIEYIINNVQITSGHKIVEFVIKYFIGRAAGFFRVAVWLLIGSDRAGVRSGKHAEHKSVGNNAMRRPGIQG